MPLREHEERVETIVDVPREHEIEQIHKRNHFFLLNLLLHTSLVFKIRHHEGVVHV